MLPIIAIIGRPNVGKSTLFNFLTQTRDALVVDFPGVTRDRQYGIGKMVDRSYWVVDTGGIGEFSDSSTVSLNRGVQAQVQEVIKEADILFFLVDGRAGLTIADQDIAQQLRPFKAKVILVVNKVDRENPSAIVSEFYKLGYGEPLAIAAKTGRGVQTLMEGVLARLPEIVQLQEPDFRIYVTVMGRPNVGKSTLINRMLGEERVIVSDQPGTTRDSIFIPFKRGQQHYMLIDTAGVRRRAKIVDVVEKFSVIKTLQSLDKAHVVIILIDAHAGLLDQDLRLLGWVVESGKAPILAVNKWDGMDAHAREQLKQALDRKLTFINYMPCHFISALYSKGVGGLFPAINEAFRAASTELSTAELTRTLMQAMNDFQPPLVKGRRIRLRYAHLGGHHPLVIVIHGKQTKSVPPSYIRYLAGYFRHTFKLKNIPVQIHLKSDANPYRP